MAARAAPFSPRGTRRFAGRVPMMVRGLWTPLGAGGGDTGGLQLDIYAALRKFTRGWRSVPGHIPRRRAGNVEPAWTAPRTGVLESTAGVPGAGCPRGRPALVTGC